jgi:hypothetical protein
LRAFGGLRRRRNELEYLHQSAIEASTLPRYPDTAGADALLHGCTVAAKRPSFPVRLSFQTRWKAAVTGSAACGRGRGIQSPAPRGIAERAPADLSYFLKTSLTLSPACLRFPSA